MELRLYAAILNRRKWVILVTAVVTLAVVALGTSRMTPIYSASAVARVAERTAQRSTTSDLNYGDKLRETYVFLLKSRPILEEVAGRLGLGMGVADLASAIKVESLPNTELIRVTVSNRDPRQAAAIANMLTVLLIEQGQKVYAGEGKSALEILQEQLAGLESRLGDDRTLLANLSAHHTRP